MPITSQYNLPATTNEDEFEDMVEDYFKINYPNAQRYGREGQKQYGLDIIYTTESDQSLIGIQCKKYERLSTSHIDEIIDAVGDFHVKINDNYSLEITSLIIATTAPRDTKIQNYMLKKRKELNKDIRIIFWEDIRPVIAGNNNLLRKYYPDIYNNQQSNCVTIDDLVNKFNSCIQKYKILEFIKVDPFLGMPNYLPSKVDIFCCNIKSNLDSSILLQNNKIFIAINDFTYLLEEYSWYLSTLMFTAGNYFCFERANKFLEWDKIKEHIKNTKKELNRLYSIINKGCQLFY